MFLNIQIFAWWTETFFKKSSVQSFKNAQSQQNSCVISDVTFHVKGPSFLPELFHIFTVLKRLSETYFKCVETYQVIRHGFHQVMFVVQEIHSPSNKILIARLEQSQDSPERTSSNALGFGLTTSLYCCSRIFCSQFLIEK